MNNAVVFALCAGVAVSVAVKLLPGELPRLGSEPKDQVEAMPPIPPRSQPP